MGQARIEDVIQSTSEDGLQIIPSHIDLCSAELELVNTVGREIILRDALQKYVEIPGNTPDHIIIDCPPSLGILSLNALALAQEVLIPIQAEFFALQGMGKLMEVVNLVAARLNAGLKVSGIVICMYKSQTTLAKEVLKEVKSYFGDVVFQTKIRQNIRLAEAPGHGKTIFAYDKNSNGAHDYMQFAREFTGERIDLPESPELEKSAPTPGEEYAAPGEMESPMITGFTEPVPSAAQPSEVQAESPAEAVGSEAQPVPTPQIPLDEPEPEGTQVEDRQEPEKEHAGREAPTVEGEYQAQEGG
jgi:chromosome partitioning protein